MNVKKFWTDFMIGLAGPAAWNRFAEQDMRDKEVVYKLGKIKGFVEATSQITRSEVGQQWANDVLRDINQLIKMHSGDKNNG